jgi:hypothetical protein
MKFSGTVEPEALHSTARKGAAIRAIHFAYNAAKGGDENIIQHVTLPLEVAPLCRLQAKSATTTM